MELLNQSMLAQVIIFPKTLYKIRKIPDCLKNYHHNKMPGICWVFITKLIWSNILLLVNY